METKHFILLSLAVTFCIFHNGLTDGQRSYGEPCSLRSQVANFFRENDSPEGCMSSKGLVCLNHKCSCADPTNVFEAVDTSESSGSPSSIQSAASSFFKNLIKGSTTTTSTTVKPVAEGKCVGRAGSPCFLQNSTCVAHAKCEGTPRLCKCTSIYSSNAQGYCSKTASVVSQVIKTTIG